MKTRALWLCLLLAACPKEEKNEEHAATAVVAAAPKPAPDAAVAEAAPAAPETPPPLAQLEVGFSGKIDPGKLKAERLVFVVAKSTFDAKAEALEVLEQQDVSAGDLFTEMQFDPGTVANLYALAFDKKGQMVGFAAHAKNPVTFEGEGKVELKDLDLKLTSVKARPAPKGM